MILAPKVPAASAHHPFGGRERSKVAVLTLGRNEFGDERLQVISEFRVAGQPEPLDGRDEVLAGKLPGPRQQVPVRPAVAVPEHLEHGRVRTGRGKQPVAGIGRQALRDGPPKIEFRPRRTFEARRDLIDNGLRGRLARAGFTGGRANQDSRKIKQGEQPSRQANRP